MSILEIHEGKHCQSCFTLENTAVAHVNSINCTKSAIISSDHGAETRASLLCLDTGTSRHISFLEQITVMDDP